MQLIKGRKTGREETRNEQKFRFPATEEIWEVSCDEGQCDQQQGRKKADLKAAS
jgi:hypothetical protein